MALGVALLVGRTGGKLHWFWGKKLRQTNMEYITKRVRLPLPCEIFIGGGYVPQEAEQKGGRKALTFPVFGSENSSADATGVPQLATKICNVTREQIERLCRCALIAATENSATSRRNVASKLRQKAWRASELRGS